MGITISYRGTLADLDRIEDFEDRVLDLSLELGGQARIWRTTADHDPTRAVRGIVLDLCPGQETTSLLVSPEGWLINLTEIEDAENGKLTEAPWCFVKTQFGSLEGHVALVEMFTALKAEFLPDLEVRDEGEYWETRDVKRLAGKLAFLQKAIEQFGKGLERYGLSPEAVEDPEILAARIVRVAELVHKTLKRPSEHSPVHWEDGCSPVDAQGRITPEEEARWDAMFKQNRRMQERMQRAIEERLAQGESVHDALDAAMREETAAGLPADMDEDDEDWRDSLPEEPLDDAFEDDGEEPWDEGPFDAASAAGDDFEMPKRHPLQQRASDLLMRLHNLLPREGGSGDAAGVLMHGAMEISGGLAQALGFADDDESTAGLCVVQLKRALRGAAFAIGALFPLRADGRIDQGTFDELYKTLEELQSDIYDELRRKRGT